MNEHISTIFLPKIILAPMAGVTDRFFRILCRRRGCALAVSEMVSSLAIRFGDLKTAELAEIRADDAPLAIQIFGHEPEWMSHAAKRIASGEYRGCKSAIRPHSIDINMGCPVKKIVSNGDGSALMKTPKLCGEIVSACRKAMDDVDKNMPLTVKIRAGWDFDSVNAVEIAQTAEASGAAAVTIHGRTREQMYSPSSSNAVIRDVVKAVSIPVIGNGDIHSGADALRMLEETDCASVMVARGAMGNPFIFDEIAGAIAGTPYIQPEPEERIAAALEHLTLVTDERGEAGNVHDMRAAIGWYIKNFRDASALRASLHKAETAQEMMEILKETGCGL